MARVVALLLVALLAAAAPASAQQPAEVRVMTFNFWLGGDVVDFGSVIASTTTTSRSPTRTRACRARRRSAGWRRGRYVARLMKDDGYAEPARSSFTVAR